MNININLAEFGSVIMALLLVGGILKNAFPSFPNRLIPLITWLLGVVAYLAISKGWSDPGQWIAAIVAAATATGTHSGIKNSLGPDPYDPTFPPKLPLLLLGGVLSLGLVGCVTPSGQRPPSPTEQKYFEIQTNIVPVVVLVTNTPAPVTNGNLVTLSAPVVQAVTNQQERYTFTPNANAQLVAGTGGAVGNLWGVGGAVSGAILGVFSLWGLFRSRKSAVASAAELAQIIETGRQILLTMPNGAKYEAAWKDWMVKHQSETQTIAQVSQLVALAVDNDKAKGAAQTIVNLIAAQPK